MMMVVVVWWSLFSKRLWVSAGPSSKPPHQGRPTRSQSSAARHQAAAASIQQTRRRGPYCLWPYATRRGAQNKRRGPAVVLVGCVNRVQRPTPHRRRRNRPDICAYACGATSGGGPGWEQGGLAVAGRARTKQSGHIERVRRRDDEEESRAAARSLRSRGAWLSVRVLHCSAHIAVSNFGRWVDRSDRSHSPKDLASPPQPPNDRDGSSRGR